MNQLVMHRLLVSSQFASRSMDGPISCSSTRGVLEPDFFNCILEWD